MSTTCKYYKQKKQVSYDNGQTWQDVSPAEYQRGDLYETLSRDCGYSEMYKYEKIGEECENGDLYKIDEEFVSYDGGETWVSTGVIRHTVIERDSDQCRVEPEPGENKFEWAWQGHESSYSTAITSTVGSFELVPFNSAINGTNVNAVLSADVDWIVTTSPTYINQNELRPGYREMVGVQRNTGQSSRTGTLTLTQKGTSNTITCTVTQQAYTPDCTVKSFTIGDEVCKGESLNYSYKTVDTSCSSEFTFRLWDSAGNMLTSNSTPSGGSGSGSFNTTNAALGGATVDVTVNAEAKRYNINVVDCTTPVEDITVNFTLTNKTGSGMYFDRIMVMGTNLYLSVGSQYLNNNQSRTCAVTLGGDVAGTAFTGIQVADTLNARREYMTNSTGGTLTDGATITANITEMI